MTRNNERDTPRPADVLNDLETYVNPGRARIYRLLGMDSVEWFADGSLIRDTVGKEFIDFCAGYAVTNAGHRHPRIVAAVKDCLDRIGLSTNTMLSAGESEVAKRLAELLPGDLRMSFFSATGAEANEFAMKMARVATGRKGYVATYGGYHGMTMGALSLTGKGSYRDAFAPLLEDVRHVPYDDLGAMETAVDSDTAAVVVEPVQGEAGARVPADNYLAGLREICDQNGSLLIFDEVQTGMGRTGENFACELFGVVPDMITLAKGLGGGILPVAATAAKPEIFRVFDENPYIHASTTGGNPLSMAAAAASLDVLVEEDLAGQARDKGEIVLTRLKEIQSNYPEIISEVRGVGLLTGIAFDNPAGGLMVLSELFERGVLVIPSLMDWTVMRLAPPLNIDRETLDRGLDILTEVVENVAPNIAELK
ncbi:MAG: aspartate aminotransferase family protein [Clostridia bacterium]